MLRVTEIKAVPGSTIWYGVGVDEQGREIRFVGDWRPMRDIWRAMQAGDEVHVEPPDYALGWGA